MGDNRASCLIAQLQQLSPVNPGLFFACYIWDYVGSLISEVFKYEIRNIIGGLGLF